MEQEKNGTENGIVDAVIIPDNVSPNSVPFTSALMPTSSGSAELMPIADLLKKAWEIYTMRFWKFMGMFLVAFLGAVPIIIIFSLYSFLLDTLSVSPGVIMKIVLGIAGLIALFIFVFVALVSQASIYILAGNLSRNFSIKEAFAEGRMHVWQFFVINTIMGLTIFLWTLLFVVPGIIMAIAYSLALWAYFYEGHKNGAALKRSRELVKGNWFAVFMRIYGLNILLYFVMTIPFIIFNSGISEDIWSSIMNIVMSLASPFFIVCGSLVFQELRAIKGESKLVK